jgi:predicted MFS family arabinose efflux permease
MAQLLRVPAIFAGALLGLVSYGCLLAIRGLWVGPYLEQAQGLSPSAAGNVAFLVSAVMIAAPLAFGLADRRGWPRAPMLAAGFLVAAAALLLLGALRPGPLLAAALLVVFAAGASAFVLQYADIRAAAPPGQEGRALSLLNLAFLVGVAACQVGAGALLAALGARLDPAEAYGTVLAVLGVVLAIAALAFLALRLRDQRAAGASRIQEPASKR